MNARIHTTPLHEYPAWAVLQRRLFDEIETAWRLFAERYTEADGRLQFRGSLPDRDGVDDFYEPFFNWPAFHMLGGSRDILDAAKRHWEGVTTQLAEAGMLTDEYENGYDWFHQGESLLFFYGLCAADPADERFAARARRFAELYTDPVHGNYDAEQNIIRAPHNGARGPLDGLGPRPQPYASTLGEMRPYGLPLQHVADIEVWDDLGREELADRMGREMHRLAVGDVPVNLAATSLVANRWLYDGDEDAARWIVRYVDGWRERARRNGGLVPDNVAPDGTIGGLHEGRWYGGHYGWAWPHGLPSVGMGVLIGGINAAFVTGDDSYLDPARIMLDTVLDAAITATADETEFSLSAGWRARLGRATATPMTLVPHRHGKDGWFDYGPLSLDLPVWLWWWSRSDDDWGRLRRAIAGHPITEHRVMPFRDKAEAGHEAAWIEFLAGEFDDYPVHALSMALGQVARRVALIRSTELDPDGDHLHFWQRVNPVVTEVLSQLVTGTPQVLYNGGLPFSAVDYTDIDAGRAGLPADVAALVRTLDPTRIGLELVNLSMTHARRVAVTPGRFGRHRLVGVVSVGEDGADRGTSTAYAITPGSPLVDEQDAADEVIVELPPSSRAVLTLVVADATTTPAHRRVHAEASA